MAELMAALPAIMAAPKTDAPIDSLCLRPERNARAFPDRIVNTHPSLLPAFRGAHAVRDALAFGVKVSGCTVHLVDEEVDHGPVLFQAAVPVEDGDDEERLHQRIKREEHRLLPTAVRLVAEGRVRVEGATACPNTKHSSSEFDAIRLAPCSPDCDTSPIAYSPGRSVRPARSIITPPQL